MLNIKTQVYYHTELERYGAISVYGSEAANSTALPKLLTACVRETLATCPAGWDKITVEVTK